MVFPLSATHGSIEPVALVVFPCLPVLVCTTDETEHIYHRRMPGHGGKVYV